MLDTFCLLSRRILPVISGLLLLGVGSIANASLIIDFEGATGFSSGIGSFLDVDEYRFTISGGATTSQLITNQNNIGVAGDTSLFVQNNTQVSLSRVDNNLFDLLSFDIAGSFQGSPQRYASIVTATGGSTSVTGVPLDGVYTSVAANLLGVASVSFVPTVNANGGLNNNEFTLDNLSVRTSSAVPVPATLALLGLGVFCLRLRRKA